MRRGRAILAGLGIALLLVLVLALETSAKLAATAAPSAEQVRSGQANYYRLRDTLAGSPPASAVSFSDGDARAIVALAGNALHLHRVDAGVGAGRAWVAASIALPLGLWLNARLVATPAAGFPALTAQVGDLPVPGFATRGGVEAVAALLRLRGYRLPALDDLVRRFAISGDRLDLLLKSPVLDTGMVVGLVGLVTDPADAARTATLYCALVAAQVAEPSRDIAVHLARAMALGKPVTAAAAVAENRAALVAVTMLAVGPRAGRLAVDAGKRVKGCRQKFAAPRLAGRDDLAKHWSLSAALAATVDGDIGEAMGNWKELSDSLPGGSGFSLVDLSADRAGLAVGRAAIDPARALAFRAQMAAANNAQLLPLDATALGEGLSNAEFVARYGDIESDDYRTALAGIDALLKSRGVLGSR